MKPSLPLAATLLLLASLGQARAADIDPEDLRHGLVTSYRDSSTPSAEVIQLEPSVGLTLKANESPHPRLSADGGVYRWQGYVLVLRAGDYRFRAVLRGKIRLLLDSKEVFAVESKETATTKESGEVPLKEGVRKFEVEFTRFPGDARLELWWSSPFFRTEPIPFDSLGHLPKELPKRLADDLQIEEGRLLAEEHGCRSCHAPAQKDTLAGPHRGPNLTEIGERVHAGWLLSWLEDPQKVRPGSRMPKLFADGEGVERHALAAYLSSLGGPLTPTPEPPDDKPLKTSAERGRSLFMSVGCVVCHDPDEKPGRSEGAHSNYPLTALAAKTTPEQLAAYLLNPLAVDPSGRMPNMLLQAKEADDLAQFLCRARDAGEPAPLSAPPPAEKVAAAFAKVEPSEAVQTRFTRLSRSEQLQELGKRLMVSRRCVNCHEVGGTVGKVAAPAATFDTVQKKPESGCMAPNAARRGTAPGFGFTEIQRQALKAFLASATERARSPLHEARMALRRFNCLGCHTRDGAGGLSSSLVEELRKHEKAENAEAVSPPPLTGVGHKLRTQTLRDVLLNASRARPWMGLRMPQFGASAVGTLSEALAHLEGTIPDDTIHKVRATPETLAAGRHLVGKTAFGCTSCHDIAGIPNTGTRGPDLVLTNQRVRYEWWQRWLEQPQRMQPGTRMPTVFTEGKSLLPMVLGGKAEAQGEAMWAYLAQGPTLLLPDGMEPPPGLTLAVRNRAVMLRTFMPDAGSRAFAVGYPGGVALAFDATTCRLAYSWSFRDDFLDAAPVWNDRGGNPARIVGTRFWTSPVGFPWAVTQGKEPPDFTTRAKDPAWGASLPDRTLFEGVRRLFFDGYSLDEAGRPTFRYYTRDEGGRLLEIREQPAPLQSSSAPGLRRRFTLKSTAGATVWLLAGESMTEPRLVDVNGTAIQADWKSGRVEADAGDWEKPARTTPRYLVLPQTERVVVLDASGMPRGTRWDVRRRGDVWQAVLRLTDLEPETVVHLDLWAPTRDESALLKELRRP